MRIYLSLKRMKALYQITHVGDSTVGVCVTNMGPAGGVAGESNSIRSSPSREFIMSSKSLERARALSRAAFLASGNMGKVWMMSTRFVVGRWWMPVPPTGSIIARKERLGEKGSMASLAVGFCFWLALAAVLVFDLWWDYQWCSFVVGFLMDTSERGSAARRPTLMAAAVRFRPREPYRYEIYRNTK